MRIEEVHIRNYRSVRELTLGVDDLTVLIGANGSGKSSVLYALNWFFNGTSIDVEDLYRSRSAGYEDEDAWTEGDRIEVTVRFTDLDTDDRAVLGKYGKGDSAWFRRSWHPVDGEKKIGNALQGPGFADVRSMPNVDKMKAAYLELREVVEGLPDVRTKTKILPALDEWEEKPEHSSLLEPIEDDQATHMFGFTGDQTLAKRFEMILVPGASDLVSEVASDGRGSALARLIGRAADEAATFAVSKWKNDHAEELERFSNEVNQSVSTVTLDLEARINEHFDSLVPLAAVKLLYDPPDVAPKTDIAIRSHVLIDGGLHALERQGHGVQRAALIAAVQAIAASSGDTNDELSGPALLLAIEEPEIYQHPVRARHFSAVLDRLSKESATQVAFCTHSPLFVHPERFEQIRRFRLEDGETRVISASIAGISDETGINIEKLASAVERELPRRLADGFFSDGVVAVEGDVDRAVFSTVADRLGLSYAARGIELIDMGSKENLRIPIAILEALDVPTYCIFDGDAGRAERKHTSRGEKYEKALESNRRSTEVVLDWLPDEPCLEDGSHAAFGGPSCVTDRWAMLEDDIESVLAEWPGYEDLLKESFNLSLRSKKAHAHRHVSEKAELASMPTVLAQVTAAALVIVDQSRDRSRPEA